MSSEPPVYRRYVIEVVCPHPCRLGREFAKNCLRNALRGECRNVRVNYLAITPWRPMERFETANVTVEMISSSGGEQVGT